MIIGGKVIERLAPDALAELAGGRIAAVVSATNGKTTTTKLLATAVGATGPVVSQPTAANMTDGVLMALAAGDPDGQAVLEVDEAYLPLLYDDLHPRVLLLGNLSRDQLDRMNEVAMVARKWHDMIDRAAPGTTVVANADDPTIVWAARDAEPVVWVAAGQAWTSDSSVCLDCGALLARPDTGWECTGCDLRRPQPAWELDYAAAPGASGVSEVRSTARRLGDGAEFDLSQMRLPGRFNASNAALALACCEVLGLDLDESASRMSEVESVSGRFAIVDVGGLRVRLLLAKNPAGWSELFDIMPPAPAPVIVAVNSNPADGRDPSWLWDVPFEHLAGRVVIATGDRRRDLAVRLLHGDVEHVVVENPYAIGAALPEGTREQPAVDVAATYTQFHSLRTRAAAELEDRR